MEETTNRVVVDTALARRVAGGSMRPVAVRALGSGCASDALLQAFIGAVGQLHTHSTLDGGENTAGMYF